MENEERKFNELLEKLENLTKNLEKRNSKWRIFLVDGILSGFGKIIGMTIIFAIFIYIVGIFLNSSDGILWISDFLEKIQIEKFLAI